VADGAMLGYRALGLDADAEPRFAAE
jgi:hypothetical protein